MKTSTPAGRWIAALLALGAALFAVGSVIERSAEAAERERGDEEAHARGRQPVDDELPARIGRAVGIDAESPATAAALIGASLALAALAWLRPQRVVLGFAAVFAVGHATLDAIEARHQLGKATLVAVLAATVAVVHAIAGLLALREVIAQSDQQ